KLSQQTAPFAESIARTVASFYQTRGGQLDDRITARLGKATVRLADRIAQASAIPATPTPIAIPARDIPAPDRAATVLVLGGTGFIGQSLVKRLRQAGYGVRLLSRNPNSCPTELLNLGIEVVRGDFTHAEAIDAALDGIESVFHLARGQGKTWEDYQKTDVAPTLKLAELCLKHQVKRLVY
ncbi:MAG: NAD-dependent epimerase/dehydratase family protein, partial [Thermosynechococcaceae cyanobacterium]